MYLDGHLLSKMTLGHPKTVPTRETGPAGRFFVG
jgi:hypothetical protein